MNIYEKMSAITEEITAVAKNLNVGWGKNSYKAVGEADVLAAVKPIEAKHGIYSYPYRRQVIDTSILTSVKADGSETKQLFMRVETVYRFVNTEKPEEYIDITTYGDGVDSQDKAPGKAMTYGDKYALLKAYKIITGEDPDQDASKELKGKSTKTRTGKEKEPAEPQTNSHADTSTIEEREAKALESRCKGEHIDVEGLLKLYQGAASISDLTYRQYDNIIKHWDDVKKRYGGGNE